MITTLLKLPLGKSGVIKKIRTTKTTEERLHSFGLVRGIEVTPLRATPLGCPRIYSCLNTEIAIRNDDAKLIEVSY